MLPVEAQRPALGSYVDGHSRCCCHSSNNGSTRTETCIYGSFVLSVLLYGAESWRITRTQLQWLDAFHHRCLRTILGVRWSDPISTEELLRRTPQCHIGTTILRLRLRWLGHVMRMPAECVARQVLFEQLRGTRLVSSLAVSVASCAKMYYSLTAVGVRLMACDGINSAWRRLYSGIASIKCHEAFRSLHGL